MRKKDGARVIRQGVRPSEDCGRAKTTKKLLEMEMNKSCLI
jgi:hypothetical protein